MNNRTGMILRVPERLKRKYLPAVTTIMILLLCGCWGENPISPNAPKADLVWTQRWLGQQPGDPDYAEVRGFVSNKSGRDATNLTVIFVLKEGGTSPSQYISNRIVPAGYDSLAIVARTRVSYLYVDSTFIDWQ